MKRTIHGIDPYAPGGLTALMAHHYATFGDAVMETDPGAPPAGGDGTPPAAPPAADPPPAGTTPPAGGTPPAAPPAAEKVEDLPAWAQKIITDARKDAGDNRTGKTAAEQQLAAIQKALNPEAKAGDKPDPEQLAKDLATRDAEALSAKRELAVFKAAGKQGADADALLDSRAFLAKIADIDPAKTADIVKAIEDAVKENPKLKLALAASKSGVPLGGGPGDQRTSKVTNLSSAIGAHYGA